MSENAVATGSHPRSPRPSPSHCTPRPPGSSGRSRGFAYASPLGPQPGDDDIAALLHYLGRRPDWTG